MSPLAILFACLGVVTAALGLVVPALMVVIGSVRKLGMLEAMVYSTADSSATVSTVFQYMGARYAQTWH